MNAMSADKERLRDQKYSFFQLLLTVIFTVALLLSNVIVNKQISLPFGASTVGSVILFPLTYVLSDIFSEVYGYRWSRVICYIAFGMNILMVLIFEATLKMPYPETFTNQAAFEAVLLPFTTVFARFVRKVESDAAPSRILNAG